MFLPISTDTHDGSIGMVSVGIAALCLVVHLFVGADIQKTEMAVAEETKRIQREYADSLAQDTSSYVGRSMLDIWDSLYSDTDMGVRQIERTMSNLVSEPVRKKVEEATLRIQKESRVYKLGLVANEFSFFNLLSHMFVHGGWFHLIGNLWFFYICGVIMERYWGHVKFALSYLACGVVAALAQIGISSLAGASMDNIPLVGASGAIAGAMGAFMITHHRTKVKIFYTIGFRGGVFDIGALWYCLAWVVVQVFWVLMTLNSGAPVGYIAHVAGFVTGVVLGFAIPGADAASRVKPATSTAYFGTEN